MKYKPYSFIIFVSAKLTKWIGGDTVFIRLCLCLSVCVCDCVCDVCTCSELVNQTVGMLNANSSQMVKATEFKFDTHVSRDSPHMIP